MNASTKGSVFPVSCASATSGVARRRRKRMLAALIAWCRHDPRTNTLLDHLVGALHEGLRNRNAENLGGLEVNHQFELGWLLNGEIGGLRAL